jgi:predicted nucleic acid-binding protein
VNDVVCVDACVAVKWLVPESDSGIALHLLAGILAASTTIVVPPHMPVEVVNTIHRKAKREEITPAEAERALATFLALTINITIPDRLYESSLLLAQRFDRPTVYDTQYVALAQIAGCEFWTADQKLLNSLDGRLAFVRSLSSFVG